MLSNVIKLSIVIKLLLNYDRVSNPVPGGPMSCRVQLQPKSSTPESSNQGLTRHTRNFQEGVLRKGGAKLCRKVSM